MSNITTKITSGLYFICTPIGNAQDITLRALDILQNSDVLVCEDTRTTLNLLQLHGTQRKERPVLSYHDHSGNQVREKIMAYLREGLSVAYASDAGTPLVADPGYKLLLACIEENIPVTMTPGASASIMALGLSGLPTDRFLFAGFLPAKSNSRVKMLQSYAAYPTTLIFYESPHRITETLEDILSALGNRPIALCRELTKMYEEIRRGTVSEVLESCQTDPPRGEIVLVIAGNTQEDSLSDEDLRRILEEHMARETLKDAVQAVSEMYNLPRKRVYKLALEIANS
jgi:16S rRNA (cytidine1402-2'-O)-methyltransferase